MSAFDAFTQQWTVLLTTYRRDGTPVGTPVNLAVEGDRAYFRSPGTAWKVKRLRRDPRVEIAPSTLRGRATGPATGAIARRLEGDEERHAADVLGRRYPVFQRFVIPLMHRLMRCGTAHYELSPRARAAETTRAA
jgi:hypothetical protein